MKIYTSNQMAQKIKRAFYDTILSSNTEWYFLNDVFRHNHYYIDVNKSKKTIILDVTCLKTDIALGIYDDPYKFLRFFKNFLTKEFNITNQLKGWSIFFDSKPTLSITF